MTYSAGNTVLAADFNAFHSDVEDIFEDNNSNSVAAGALIFGYGETLLKQRFQQVIQLQPHSGIICL
jgi:hypothetical protein